MGKRKHKDKKYYKNKKKKHHKRSHDISDSDSRSSEEEYDVRDYSTPSTQFQGWDSPASPENNYNYPLSDTDGSEPNIVRSVVISTDPVETQPTQNASTSTATPIDPGPSTSADTASLPLPAEILEALGDPKGKEELFGPNIPEEISKRWGRILVDGLNKEQKKELFEKFLVPDNFRLAKAPLLNPEIQPVLSEMARNRDRLLEKSQNQLGVGISGLTNLASCVIEGNINKIEIVKMISDISQIFLDLHYEDTKRRRKLVTSSLDKRFLNMITDVKRDNFLFGMNLGEKIKASKTAERSGLQIKRQDVNQFKKQVPNQGNWRGPPRTQDHRAYNYRRGGSKNRYAAQTSRSRRPAPRADHLPRPAPKMSAATSHKSQ